jgi:hypothetical protein
MSYIDIFNGDADGICALVQMRNAQPVDSQLVTGVKRDIQLVDKIQYSADDRLTVLDISFDKNRKGVEVALSAKTEIFYVDHHFAGNIPENEKLTTIINPASDTCTSILMNEHLNGKYVEWAIVGAFGDNLKNSAHSLAKHCNLSRQKLQDLENFGIYMNYNGYGSDISDLHFPPADLFNLVRPYANPFDFMTDSKEVFEKLEDGYINDMASAKKIKPCHQTDHSEVYVLPNVSWARRVSGVYSNDLANSSPQKAHAVLTEKVQGNYVVSVRAPIENKTGADELCRRFPSGGGRKAAAGINELPFEMLNNFIEQFSEFYAG